MKRWQLHHPIPWLIRCLEEDAFEIPVEAGDPNCFVILEVLCCIAKYRA